jgi:hypothetical protein
MESTRGKVTKVTPPVATMRDERTRSQALAVIQDLVANLETPLSGGSESGHWKFCTKFSVWVRWSRYYRTQASTTFW